MRNRSRRAFLTLLVSLLAASVSCKGAVANTSQSNSFVIDARNTVEDVPTTRYKGGAAISPTQGTIAVTPRFLTLNDKPWYPVMGEFHYSRYPQTEWEEELLKMKAGGVNVVATYIFWNHQEERKGHFNWNGQRDLRQFVELCNRDGLLVMVRIGPWVHGESRYGGLPDWVVKGSTPRTTDPRFMGFVDDFYRQIGTQLKGLLWKDGGPIIGVQIENEYNNRSNSGGSRYLLSLKDMARRAGLDVPLYTLTAWDNAIVPDGEFLPVYGGYPDAPWDSSVKHLPPSEAYLFRFQNRVSGDMGTIGNKQTSEDPMDTVADTPFLTAEVGAGIQDTYHRRPVVSADDIAALASTIVGSGANLLGFYMFQGGTNPDGPLGPLNESKSTGYPTDVPQKSYDFQAPLSEYGLERSSFRQLKLLNYFLNDFGSSLAPMTSHPPSELPHGPSDLVTPRVSLRSNGSKGFLFVNNYVRGYRMEDQRNFQVRIELPNRTMEVPAHPVTLPSGAYCIWPVNLDLDGIELLYSTAQPLQRIQTEGSITYFFIAAPGIIPEFAFSKDQAASLRSHNAKTITSGDMTIVRLAPSMSPAFEFVNVKGLTVRVVVLDHESAMNVTRVRFAGEERLILSAAEVFADNQQMTLRSLGTPAFAFRTFPPLPSDVAGSLVLTRLTDRRTAFTDYSASATPIQTSIQATSVTRRSEASSGTGNSDSIPPQSFIDKSPMWTIAALPKATNDQVRLFLKIKYVADMARLSDGSRLLADDFYNGTPWQVSLSRLVQLMTGKTLTLTLVPWRAPQRIILESRVKQTIENLEPRLVSVEVEPQYELRIR